MHLGRIGCWTSIQEKITIAFITPSLAAILYAGAFSEERKFEIIGHLQRMIDDTHGFYSKSLTKYVT